MVEVFMIRMSYISTKLILLIVWLPFFMLATVACDTEDEAERAEIDRNKILKYLQDNETDDYYEHESGVFISIDKPGEGGHPHEESTVHMKHSGYLLDGEYFHNPGVAENVYLPNVVRGLRIGVMELRHGSFATIFVPSALGFGRQGTGNIPRNAVLIFDVEIIQFT